MNDFQLDECMDCKRLVRACTSEGRVKVLRFPSRLKTKEAREERKQKDESILPYFLTRDPPFVTSDKPIVEHNISSIPESHPGVIIIMNDAPNPETTFEDMAEILDRFKKLFPRWHTTTWRNSIVEITQSWVDVKHIEKGVIVSNAFLRLDDPACEMEISRHLEVNAKRGQRALPAPGQN